MAKPRVHEVVKAAIAFLNEAPQEGDYALLVISLKGGGPTDGQREMIAEYGRKRKRLYDALVRATERVPA